ncbi:hypothetical protein PGT21_005769 [Puccinia graminis f. sp. tritici]|uniref:Uncharacterized protein n=1 Tax=Puccinia graminis f. sp. tritici TaxID=56615 RepID=A0A5B0MWG6_PUCGR|nr:hypothetical protein PGT21_005769 [Puccinia graminis f. sp. tritici]
MSPREAETGGLPVGDSEVENQAPVSFCEYAPPPGTKRASRPAGPDLVKFAASSCKFNPSSSSRRILLDQLSGPPRKNAPTQASSSLQSLCILPFLPPTPRTPEHSFGQARSPSSVSSASYSSAPVSLAEEGAQNKLMKTMKYRSENWYRRT